MFSFWNTGSVGECLRIGFGFLVSWMVPLGAFYFWCDYVSTYPLQFAKSWMARDNLTKVIFSVLGKVQKLFRRVGGKIISDRKGVKDLEPGMPTLEQQLF